MSAYCGNMRIASDCWIIHSGATHHMTPIEDYCLEIDKRTATDVITMADGSTTPSAVKGTAKARLIGSLTDFQEFTARDALLAPNIGHGIITVWALTKNRMTVIFDHKRRLHSRR